MSDNSANRRFKANGKLMLTGEYLVLAGAEALALPLSREHELQIQKSIGRSALAWKTFVEGEYWFDAYFSLPELAIANTNDFPTAQNLRNIFLAAQELNLEFLNKGFHYEISSKVNFNMSWGLGSSSSLLVTIAKWADVDPFDLHFKVSSGSGYDIAAAMTDRPVFYRLEDNEPVYSAVDFNPSFRDNIFFGYLGKKRKSEEAVKDYLNSGLGKSGAIKDITSISREVIHANTLMDFVQLLKQHDEIISNILHVKPIAQTRFSDFKGYVKSLGAWGGDFALFITDYPRDYLMSYFRKKDIKTWFEYRDLIKSIKPGVNV
jgi:mevalonate kinase